MNIEDTSHLRKETEAKIKSLLDELAKKTGLNVDRVNVEVYNFTRNGKDYSMVGAVQIFMYV